MGELDRLERRRSAGRASLGLMHRQVSLKVCEGRRDCEVI